MLCLERTRQCASEDGNMGLGAPSLHLSIKVMESHSPEHQETIETVAFITMLFSLHSLLDLLRCCHSVLDYGFYPIRAQRQRQQAATSAQSGATRRGRSTDTTNGLLDTGRHFLRTSWRSPSHQRNQPFGCTELA